MARDSAFFYQVLKPGRYQGGEPGLISKPEDTTSQDIVWFYPDRYERAMTDPAWRRSYFQVAALDGIRVSRVVEYASDVWNALSLRSRPVFTLDSLDDISEARRVIFWAPDVLTAAHIPALIRRCRLEAGTQEVAVLCDGGWIPRFLIGHVDWIAPAPGGWLPRELLDYFRDGGALPSAAIPMRDENALVKTIEKWRPRPLARHQPSHTPRWVPCVEVEDDYIDVDLVRIDDSGEVHTRDLPTLVVDALDGLTSTGVDGLRFCEFERENSRAVVNTLTELQRRFNTKRIRAHLPPITIDEFQRDWLAYKPHLLKPTLRFAIRAPVDSDGLILTGRAALNAGWQGLHAVLEFDSYESLTALLDPLRRTLKGWSQAVAGYPDKRPLRLEYRPANVDRWRDAPDGPPDDAVRQYSAELRDFKEDVSRSVAVGSFRIEEVMAQIWLAATQPDLYERLAALDLCDPNDSEAPPFDWFNWVRQESGLTAPPQSRILKVERPVFQSLQQATPPESPDPASILDAPSGNLFGRRRQKAVASRRLAGPSLTRMRVRWAKEMPWRLFSHLDLVRAIERAIRRANLPASYSEGFHPRLKLSFGPPLTFGLLSDAEYFDLMLDEDYQPADGERLARQFPEGLRVVAVRGAAAGMPALSDAINEVVYEGIIPMTCQEAQERLDDFHRLPEVRWQRIGREDSKPVDPRKTLRDVSVVNSPEGTRWTLTLQLGGEGNIRPTEWAMLLFGFRADQMADIILRRTDMLIRRGATLRTPLDPL